ncbi:MAG: YegS/Rv2252/BmrU family lipid kinase [Oscillospiraceae bacterium]|nr:YegS/Rv2252/BmrU family lipid kinase [Oscillospiraceae bacterium]
MEQRKFLFIVNPAAGMPGAREHAVALIRARCAELKQPCEMVFTEYPGHAAKLALEHTDKENDWLVFACGGDGTLNEVACGAVYRPNLAITHIPFGTGNDFIRLFDDPASIARMDVLRGYDLLETDIIKAGDRFCLNTCCMGFDARSADRMQLYRRTKRINPKIPYNLGVATALLGGLSRRFALDIDGETLEGRYTLVSIMNGRYYGGGFNPAPHAVPDDGLLDIVIVKAVNLVQFSRLITPYARGEHDKLKDFLILRRGVNVRVKTVKPIPIAFDGEMAHAGQLDVTVLPRRVKFAVPNGVKWVKPREISSMAENG